MVQRGEPRCAACGKELDWPPIKTINKPINSKVAGVSHPNDDGSSRQEILSRCKMVDIFALKRHPIEQDQNGIVLLRDTGEQVGWVTRVVAQELAPYMDKGAEYHARITALTGGGRYTRGCNIEIHEGGAGEMRTAVKSTTNKIGLVLVLIALVILAGCFICYRSL